MIKLRAFAPATMLLATTVLATPALAQRVAPPAVAIAQSVTALRDAALKDDVAYDIVSGITTEVGPRPDGSPAEERARQWAFAKLNALGFKNVRIEPYELKNVWVRGVETAEVLGSYAQPLRLTALGNSGATPAAGLTRRGSRSWREAAKMTQHSPAFVERISL